MVKKSTQIKQATENSTSDVDVRRTRRSTRIQGRVVDATSNTIAVVSHKATISDVPRTRRVTRSTSIPSPSKKKHKRVNEKDNTFNKSTNTQRSKKYKITASSNLIPKQPSTTIVQEALVASLVVIQDTTVPRVTKYNKM